MQTRPEVGQRVRHRGLRKDGTVVADTSRFGLESTSTLVHFDDDMCDEAREVTTGLLDLLPDSVA